jgi:hypothetical protein
MGTHMKTTVDIADDLLARGKAAAQRENSTLRALLEEGLQLALKRRQARAGARPPQLPTFGRGGLSAEFEGADWQRVRDEVHGLSQAPAAKRRR